MNHDYLFESDLPDGVKSVFLNGKKIYRSEFLSVKRNSGKRDNSNLNLKEFLQIVLVIGLSIILFLYLKK